MAATDRPSTVKRESWWEILGRVTAFVLAWLAIQAGIAIIALYWPEVHEFIVDGLLGLGLVWLFFWRGR